MERVRQLLGSDDSTSPSLTVLRDDLIYHPGSVAPLLGTAFRQGTSGLMVPLRSRDRTLADYVSTYLTSSEYWDEDPRSIARSVIDLYPTEDLIVSLSALGRIASDDAATKSLADAYASDLNATSRRRIQSALSGRKRFFLARQPILDAISLTLSRPAPETREVIAPSMPVDTAAILLIHAVADLLGGHVETPVSEDRLGDGPSGLEMWLVQNWYFNTVDDPMAQMVRYQQLWTVYSKRTVKHIPEPPAVQRLEAATGLGFDELMALGFAAYSHAVAWRPHTPMLLSHDLGLPKIGEVVGAFVRTISLPLDEYRRRISSARTEWDFCTFERWPIIDLGAAGLLVVDATFMLERITKGLWRYVEDAAPMSASGSWRQFYGEAIEVMAEDQVARLAPTDLGSGKAWYFTEEDFQAAYCGKACDAATCYGDDWCLFEVVTTRVSMSAKYLGDADAFIEDTKRMILKKARQLDETGRMLLAGVSSKVAGLPISATRVFPAVITEDHYPVLPATMALIQRLLDGEGLLSDPRLQPLSVLNLADLELLESLTSLGETPNDVLAGWHRSSLSHAPLRNYIHAHYAGRLVERPDRMQAQFDAALEPIFEQLGRWGILPGDETQGPGRAGSTTS